MHKCELIRHASTHLDRSVLEEKFSNPTQLLSVYTGQTAVLIKQPTPDQLNQLTNQPANPQTHQSASQTKH